VGVLIIVHPGVKINAVKGDATLADWNFGEKRPHLGVEPIAVHAEIAGRVTIADEARKDDGHSLTPQDQTVATGSGPAAIMPRPRSPTRLRSGRLQTTTIMARPLPHSKMLLEA
jgi:hypothetical protein